MERRFDQRHLTEIEVFISRLTHPTWTALGQIADISKSGVCVKAPFELVAGDIIKLEIGDSNLFGFVAHATLEGAAFRAGIEIQRVLMGDSDLSKMVHKALRQVLPGVPGVLTGSLPA